MEPRGTSMIQKIAAELLKEWRDWCGWKLSKRCKHWTGWAEFRDLGMALEKNQLGEIMQSVGEQKIVFSFLQVWSTFIFSIWNHPSFPYLLSSPSTYCNMGESHGGQLSSLLSQSALVDSLRGPNTTLRLNSHMAPQPRNGDVWGKPLWMPFSLPASRTKWFPMSGKDLRWPHFRILSRILEAEI